jgi:hypothetical protein
VEAATPRQQGGRTTGVNLSSEHPNKSARRGGGGGGPAPSSSGLISPPVCPLDTTPPLSRIKCAAGVACMHATVSIGERERESGTTLLLLLPSYYMWIRNWNYRGRREIKRASTCNVVDSWPGLRPYIVRHSLTHSLTVLVAASSCGLILFIVCRLARRP